ncbi:ArsR/SmtB family transcription factor [Euzebya tangerina]|uniref:ArsR/SmtB family transcription factor n=1 Tax=Euzebya tangerina TaxID=591198 RepID=UPI000E30EB5A|nr:metalloregulator ArsR/SmtB family transcription factor [Euzebya tangerina]
MMNELSDVDVPRDGLARLGTALADHTRREIIHRLLDGPAYPAQLAQDLGTSPANISNHLACLRGCGVVQATAQGRRVRYDLVDPTIGGHLAAILEGLAEPDPAHDHLA